MGKERMYLSAMVGLLIICVMPVRGGAVEPKSDIVGFSVDGGKAVPNGGVVDFGGTWMQGEKRLLNFVLKYQGKGGFVDGRIEIRNSKAFSKRPYQSTSKFVKRYLGNPEYYFAVVFEPGRAGRHHGTLIVRSGYTGTGIIDYAVELTGTAWRVEYLVLSGDGSRAIPCGDNPIMAETGTDYGRIRVGSSTSRMFLIINRWKDPWLKPNIRIVGENARDFILPWKGQTRRVYLNGKKPKPKPLAGDHRLSQYVYFAPKEAGIRRAKILIGSDDSEDQAKACTINIQGEAFD